MDDDDLIRLGQIAARQLQGAQLRLGRLALQFAPIGERGHNVGTNERIRLYAEKIGVDERTLRQYRHIAHAWEGFPVEDRSFTLLRVLAPAADKDKALEMLDSGTWTKGQLIEHARKKGIIGTTRAPQRRDPTASQLLRTALGILEGVDVEQGNADHIKMLVKLNKQVRALQAQAEKPRIRVAA